MTDLLFRCPYIKLQFMAQKYSYEDWKRSSIGLVKTKESIEEMSKLYIIAHEKVKSIIRRCQTDLTYNPISDCQRELDFIKMILQRLAQKQNDQYLSKIDPKTLTKYEKNFYDLIQLLRLALATYDSKQKIDIQSLMSIRQDQHIKKGQFSLRGELQKSENRMVRTKSGHRITKKSSGQPSNQNNGWLPEANRLSDKIELVDPQKHQDQFLEKRNRLEKSINSHINKNGYTLDFRKKYQKLEEYLQERKEFSDLLFSQKYYDQMIEMGKNRKNEPKAHEKKDPDLDKLFPEFNIKTKYLKKQVKENILKVIFDVKKQLLKEYHEANVTKMRETNDGGMIKLNFKNKPASRGAHSQSSHSTSNQRMEARFRSTNQLIMQRRHSLGNFKAKPRNAESAWKMDQCLKKQEEKAQEMFRASKMPEYQK